MCNITVVDRKMVGIFQRTKRERAREKRKGKRKRSSTHISNPIFPPLPPQRDSSPPPNYNTIPFLLFGLGFLLGLSFANPLSPPRPSRVTWKDITFPKPVPRLTVTQTIAAKCLSDFYFLNVSGSF